MKPAGGGRHGVSATSWGYCVLAMVFLGCGGAAPVEKIAPREAHSPAPAPKHARIADLEASLRASLLAEGRYRAGDAHSSAKLLLVDDEGALRAAPSDTRVTLDGDGLLFLSGECGEELGYVGLRASSGEDKQLDYVVLARNGASAWGIERAVISSDLDSGVYGRFADDSCELAVLRWQEKKDSSSENGGCSRDYSVVVINPLEQTVREVPLFSLPCPEFWSRCGPTPVCKRGASSGTHWRVYLGRPFPIQSSNRDGLMIRVADPEGGQLHFYGIATARKWHFGTRSADYIGIREDKIELLTCGDWRGARVVGTVAGRLVDYDEPPTLGLSCSAGF